MYRGVADIFSRYWQSYGGLGALLRSPYLHTAALLLVFTWGSWSEPQWWDQVIDVLPNLLGFSLGGFAMFLGFGDEKFRSLLAEPDEDAPGEPSIYVTLCASFAHFIIIQILALLWALLAKSWWIVVPWPEAIRTLLPWFNLFGGAIGYGLFLYAITSALAATMFVFRIASWYELDKRNKNSGTS